jgi:hypothetical protein
MTDGVDLLQLTVLHGFESLEDTAQVRKALFYPQLSWLDRILCNVPMMAGTQPGQDDRSKL